MQTKLFSFFTALFFLAASVPFSLAGNRQTGNWNDLRSYLNSEIAVKVENKKTVYGVLRAVEKDSLKIQVVNNRNNYETNYRKSEIEKIWQAELRAGSNAAKGALVGGGTGAAIGAVAGAAASEPDPLNYAGVILFGIAGAGLGAIIGGFNKKSGKKKKLIYKI
jgi:small nuclear ribonucleoprotein (snRNP)-like protein